MVRFYLKLSRLAWKWTFCLLAIGPLFLGPLSEIYGRSRVLQLANLWYLVWNLGCGFAQNKAQLIVFRFLAGLGGSAPLSIGGGVLGDCWAAEQRGKVGILSEHPACKSDFHS